MEQTKQIKEFAGPQREILAGKQQVPTFPEAGFDAFWKRFRLFPDPWMQSIYRGTGYLIGIPALPFLFLLALALGYDLWNPAGGWAWTGVVLREWQEIVGILGLIAIAFAYRAWLEKVAPVFRWVVEEKLKTATAGEEPDSILSFLDDFQHTLFLRRGQRTAVLIAMGAVLVFNLMAGIPGQVQFYWLLGGLESRLYAIGLLIVWVFGFALWGLYAAFAAWPILVTARFLSRLTHEYQIRIQPAHPDNCGGLKPLGDFCFSMALPIVIGGLIGAIFSLGGSFLSGIIIGPVAFGEILPQTVMFVNALLLLVFTPFSLAVFLMPIWNLHRHMAAFRQGLENDYADRVGTLEQALMDQLGEEGRLAEAKISAQKLELLRRLNPRMEGIPVWPFRWPTVAKILSPVLLNIGGFIFESLLSSAVSIFN